MLTLEFQLLEDIDVVNASRMAFSGMYRDTKINTAPSFTITGTMGDHCFNQTFRNCGELTSSALITVDALSEYCFMYMYRGCKKLDYVRSLPWSLVKGCYDGMFQECTSLTESPRLAKTTYAVDAYRQMFYGCTQLRTIDCNLLFDGEVIARSWVTNVASSGTFYKNKHQENVYYSNDCVPVGWTVYDNNYSDVRLELYGDYELIKNEDNTYNLIQYFYNCTYIDDVLESAEKTDKYATIAQDLQRNLYDTTEIIEIEGETYEVRYYYVEFRGVKYKTNEYQIIVKKYTVQWFVPNYYNISENVLVHTDKINQNENIVSPYDYKFGGNDVVWVDSNNNRVSFPQTITEDTNYYVKFVKDGYNYLPNSVFKIDGDGYYTENCSRICGDLSISYNTSGNPEFWWKRSTNPKLEIIPPNGYQVHSIIFNGLIGGGIISESDNASYMWFDSDRSLSIYKTNSEIIEDRFVYKTEDNTDRWFSNFQIVFSLAYTAVDYIENESLAYIDTGFVPDMNTVVVVDAQPKINIENGSATVDGFLYGSGPLTEKNTTAFGFVDAKKLCIKYMCYTTAKNQNISNATGRKVYKLDDNNIYIDGIIFDGADSPDFIKSDNNLVLFYHEKSDVILEENSFKGRIYSCQIYDYETLIRDFVPVKNSANVYGLYDKVNKKFYPSSNKSYNFTGGLITEQDKNQITLPYIRTSGAGGVNTGVYPTTDTWMEFEVSNLDGNNDVNIGISVNGEQGTWENPDDNSDWRFFISTTYGLYWDRGHTRTYTYNYPLLKNKLKITCKWDYFSVYNTLRDEYVVVDDTPGSGSIIQGYPIWIEPMTSKSFSGDYHYIKIYERDKLIRHYIPHVKNGVYSFLEVLSNELCYPISGNYTGGEIKIGEVELPERIIPKPIPTPKTTSYIRTAGAGGINTRVKPNTATCVEFEVSNLKSAGDAVNIGMTVNGDLGTWRNPDDNADWRFFMDGSSTPNLYWDRGSARSYTSYPYTSNRLKIICKWNYFYIYDVTLSKIVYESTSSGSGSIYEGTSGVPIWIEPMTDPRFSGDYHYIKIYITNESLGDKVLRYYKPHIDENGVYCFREVISNELCYPISGSYTGEVTFE